MKRLRILAGPNGSGKSSLFSLLSGLVNTHDYINADEIKVKLEQTGYIDIPFATGIEELRNYISTTTFDKIAKIPFENDGIIVETNRIRFSPDAINPYSVAALCDYLRYGYMENDLSFSMETVFSHPSKLDFLNDAREKGYRIYLYVIATEHPKLNVYRVQQRIAEGGHDVPDEKIISRYTRSLDNTFQALDYAYRAFFWDNSSRQMQLCAEMKPDRTLEVIEKNIPDWLRKFILAKI